MFRIQKKPIKNRCVISLGINGQIPEDHPKILYQNFPKGIANIRKDLKKNGFRGDFLSWDKNFPSGSPLQKDAHGAFKPFCFYEAKKLGYGIVLWLDASIRILKPIAPIFKIIRENGYIIFQEGHSVGEYCKDDALEPLGITRDESFNLPSCWSCVLGLNLNNKRSLSFLNEWKKRAIDNVTFPGPKWSGVYGWPKIASQDPRVKGHRYDQTAASVIAYKLGMDKWKTKSFFSEYFKNDRKSVRRMDEV